MMTPQELGWLVVITSMLLGISICVGVCLALWCKKNSGSGSKITPAALLDPLSNKNGKQTNHASLLLPSVTRSEFGSEHRTHSSTLTPLSAQSRAYWSIGSSTPRPMLYSTTHAGLASTESTLNFKDPYLSYTSVSSHNLPPKYATTYVRSNGSPSYSDRSFNRLSQWDHDLTRNEQLPLVPSTSLTYMPQPKFDAFTSSLDSGSSGSTRRKLLHDSDTDDATLSCGWSSSSQPVSPCDDPGDATTFESEIKSGIDGRIPLVSGLGYSDPEILNPNYDTSKMILRQKDQSGSVRGRRKYRDSTTRKSSSGSERIVEFSKRMESPTNSRSSSPANGMLQSDSSSISLSTGVSLGQIPFISSNINGSHSRDNSRTRCRSQRNSRHDDAMSSLGIDCKLSPLTPPPSDIDSPTISSKTNYGLDSINKSEATIQNNIARVHSSAHENVSTLRGHVESSFGSSPQFDESVIGSLGCLEIQMKYHTVQRQLVLRIITAARLPARYLVPESKLYVKVLIEGSSKYTSPLVPAADPAVFRSTLVHAISSSRLGSSSIRFSMCQLDARSRRVVIGYATLSPSQLWPILHLSTPLTHSLTTRNLLLNLTDTTPDHQIHCGGSVTFGLQVSKNLSSITIASVTLQHLTGKDIENCLVYTKVNVYRGNALILWKRSKPTMLIRQRTHLLSLLELKLVEDVQQSPGEDSSQRADDEIHELTISESLDNEQRELKDEKFLKGEHLEECPDSFEKESAAEVDEGHESNHKPILLVLSVRLKTLRRGGRCVLGSVQLGERAPTEEGREHWRRAVEQATTGVPAAGSHHLHHN